MNRIIVLHTLGHTPDSVSPLDIDGRQLCVSDVVNHDITLANVPGSDIRQTAASVRKLLNRAPADSIAREAHSDVPLAWAELHEFAGGLPAIAAGNNAGKSACLGGLPTMRHDINHFLVLLPGPDDGRLQPPGSVTEELEWLTTDCLSPWSSIHLLHLPAFA